MAKQTIDIGVQGNDGTGDSIRESFRKVNENFTQLYQIFGGDTIKFTNLDDAPVSYDPNQVIISSNDASKLTARSLTSSDGRITIDTSDDGTIDFTSNAGDLVGDLEPTLGAPMNAALLPIGNLPDPTPTLADFWRSAHPAVPYDTETALSKLAISKGYADTRYVQKSSTGVLGDALKVRNEPLVADSTNVDSPQNASGNYYDPTMTGNYLATEAVQRRFVVNRAGDTMTGKLTLNDHPAPMAGQGTPNSGDDLQAATKFYVDNSTYSSNVNLFVSASSGDDLQQKTPAGKEGRFWNYAYRSIGAAALQAENLINLASQEPGPYRQRLSYTIGPDQTFSTIQSAVLTGGNSSDLGYTDASELLRLNKAFIQAETIAYINNKYVNTFTYNKETCKRDVRLILDAVANDLVLDSTFNSTRAGTAYLNSTASTVLGSQLVQTVDAIKFARDQILNYSYSTIEFEAYLNLVIDALSYDVVFLSNYQSTQAALAFSRAGTDLSADQIIEVLENLKTDILAISEVDGNTTATNNITNNIVLIESIIRNGVVPNPKFPNLSGTSVGKNSAKELLLNNITFLQAEAISFLTTEYPNLSYSKDIYKRDIKYVSWSIVYDMLYGGNSQSVYAGLQFWIGAVRQISEEEVEPVLAVYDYLKTLSVAIVQNDSPSTVYQQSVRQYRNETLSNGSVAVTSISNNFDSIISIIDDSGNAPAVVDPSVSNGPSSLQLVRDAIIDSGQVTILQDSATDYITSNFDVINDPVTIDKISDLFQIVIDILELGINSRVDPIYSSPDTAYRPIGYSHARDLILQNIDFIQDETVEYIINQYPSVVFDNDTCKRDLKYILEGVCYDVTYGGNSGGVYAGQQYYQRDTLQINILEKAATLAAFTFAQVLTIRVSQNDLLLPTELYSSTPQYTNPALDEGNDASIVINNSWTAVRIIVDENPELPYLPDVPLTYPVLDNGAYDNFNLEVRDIIITNKQKIADATTDFLDTTFTGGFNYDESICYRDVGYIIDGQRIDLVTGGTWQSVFAGKSYYKNASARAIAIGTQLTETLDGIIFAKNLAIQVLNQTTATRYQSLVTQLPYDPSKVPSTAAKNKFIDNMAILLDIIQYGYGAAPTPSFGTGIWNVRITNGGNGYVDQGIPGNNDIIPAKVIVGIGSKAYASIVKYEPGVTTNVDVIKARLTKPGFFTIGEEIEFGETVKDLQITIFAESGIYYEDYPIRLADNVSVKGDEFRRTIVRPRDRISQSPWRKIFFYRDAVIDAMELGPIDYANDYATDTTIALGGTNNVITITLGFGQVPQSWIGKVLMDDTAPRRGKAIIDSVSGNVMNCSVIYPFQEAITLASGDWHLYDPINYGRHYLTDPLDITSPAKNNKEIDLFLCNDAIRISNLTMQGHGGFCMVLDPEGQVKTKSPYGQVCTSFSQSNNRKRFAGGQFVDGFTGRLFGTIVGIDDNGVTLTIQGQTNSGLDLRPPSPPCAFYVQGYRYQINDVVSFDSATATVVVTLDVATPYYPEDPNNSAGYNNAICSRDVGLILDAVTYDLVTGSNYQAIKAGLSYQRGTSSADIAIGTQKTQTLAGINFVRDSALALISGNSSAQSVLINRMEIINTIIEQGISATPTISYPSNSLTSANATKVRNMLTLNRAFIQAEIVAYISASFITKNYTGYSSVKSSRDTGYVVDALIYDVMYGGNSMTYDSALTYYGQSVFGEPQTNQIPSTAIICAAAMARLKIVLQQIVQGTTVTKSAGNIATQNLSVGNQILNTDPEYATVGTLVDVITDYIADGDFDSVTTRTTPNAADPGLTSGLVSARTTIINAKTTLKQNTITYLNNGGGLRIEIGMGGNKSMLANDFAMINDLGYAIVCTNSGVSEQVSTFTYYCHTHYWSLNGGQIRSVAGSNAHGTYGLRATGYDVTEKPDSVSLAQNMMQVARVYKAGQFSAEMTPTVSEQALAVYILGYDYIPYNTSELEIDHSIAGESTVRYEVTSVEHTVVTINGQNVLKLNLSTAGNNGTSSTGLATTLYDGQQVIIRDLQNVKFTGIDNVRPTRPSTALQYIDNLADIYRVIAYNLNESTGEILPDNISVLGTDSSFAYYKFATDILNLNQVDPDDPTKTQGSKIGDNKISVLQVSQQTTIDQINKGTYVTAWNGRVHRITEYVVPEFIATANYQSGGVLTTIVLVNTVAGTIEAGDIIVNAAFTSGQTVVTVTPGATTADPYTLIISAIADTTPVNGSSITFGISKTGYLIIDPNAVINIVGDGTAIDALTYVSKVVPTTGYKFVTYDIPWNPSALPIVDNYYDITGQSNTNYNGFQRVVGAVSKTQITVSDTSGLTIGMIVTCSDVNAYIPSGTILQSIDSPTEFTVSPACWIPSGVTVSSTVVAVLDSLTITNGGTGYSTPPVITIGSVVSGGATAQAIATCTITSGSITGIVIVSPGYGYTSLPDVIVEGNAVLTAVLTATATVTPVASAGVNTNQITVAYETDPGIFDRKDYAVVTAGISTTTMTVSAVTSGTLAIGQTVTGGTISADTRILSQITPLTGGESLGGIGRYTVNNSQAVSGGTTVTAQVVVSGFTSNTGPAVFVGAIVGTALTVSSLTSGTIAIGQGISGTGISSGTYITAGSGSSWTVSTSLNVGAGTTITSTHAVVLSVDTQGSAPATNKWYKVVGNTNPLYNGMYYCIASSTTSVTLSYPYEPGTWSSVTTTYIAKEVTSASSDALGIGKPFPTNGALTLRIGYAAGTTAQITQKISTTRVTGHDFLDIGTGSYSTTNYPYSIYGNPVLSRQQAQEVQEDGVGRVFYVTTDQNGIFRVGRFFTVDQGTGTVTFSASIALSNLDGLGFKRGVVVSEFSTDSTMTNNASEIVPVQSAVRGYIDKRLGLDHGGGPVPLSNLIGSGFLALNGSLAMKGNLNMATFGIGNVATPTSAFDAATKGYVDGLIAAHDQLVELRDTQFTTLAEGNIAVYDLSTTFNLLSISGNGNTVTISFTPQASPPFTLGSIIEVASVNPGGYNGTKIVTGCTNSTVQYASNYTTVWVSGGTVTATKWRNIALPATTSGNDVTLTYNGTTGLITTAIGTGKITNAMVSTSAAIAQSKLAMAAATTRANSTSITQADLGLASFNSTQFTIASGWVSLQSSTSASTGVTLAKLQYIGSNSILGNLGGTAAAPSELTPGNVVASGDGIKNASFTSASALSSAMMTVTYDGSNTNNNTYGITAVTTSGGNSSIVKTGSAGEIDAKQLKIDGYKVIDTTAATPSVDFYTPGVFNFLTATGTNGTNTVSTVYGTIDISNGTLKSRSLTTGAPGTTGSIVGDWTVGASSQLRFGTGADLTMGDGTIDVLSGTLKVDTITTGSSSTRGDITGDWHLSGTFEATYADLAEFYEGDQEYAPGTVLVFGGDKEVTTTNLMNDTRSAGVVTTDPAYVMNSDQTGIKVCIALAGRVPCKVVGRVKKGDMLTTSATTGYAMKANDPKLGAIIGKALEDKDYGEAGVIQIAVGRV